MSQTEPTPAAFEEIVHEGYLVLHRIWYSDSPTREGKVSCVVVLDVFSRRVVGWSIDATPTAGLVTNALGMAIEGRRPDGTSSIPIRASVSRLRRSRGEHSTRGSCPRWARSGVASTTR